MLDCLSKTYRSHGFLGLYRGLTISLLEITPYTAIALGGYEFSKDKIQIGAEWSNTMNNLACGWVSGLMASLFCYPMDTVKRQLMLDGSTGFKSRYNGSIINCIKVLYVEEGVMAFYRGCLLNALKSAPSCALTLVCNDAMKKLLGID